jgi:hypothetical protein
MRSHSHQIVASQIAQDVAGRHFDIDLGAKLLGYFLQTKGCTRLSVNEHVTESPSSGDPNPSGLYPEDAGHFNDYN